MKRSPISTPLTDDEYDVLADFVDEHASIDIDAVVGLLNAVAVAPTMLPPSTWIAVVFPKGIEALGMDDAQETLMLLMRLYNEIVSMFGEGQAMFPDADEQAACDSFAKGYLAGAELDPAWRSDPDRWTFASWAAYLADRRELVTPRHLVELDKDAEGARPMLRREIGAQLRAAYETLREQQARAASSQPKNRTSAGAMKVGRNEPCPCGSGKKYKRCCADAATKAN